jgi:hypothetical protein
MTSGLFTPGEISELTDLQLGFLNQTYTRRRRIAGGTDALNKPIYTYESPGTSGLPCFMDVSEGIKNIQGLGFVTDMVPEIQVSGTDPLTIGDVVQQVLDPRQVLVFAGPGRVVAIDPRDTIGGNLVTKVCRLEFVQGI